MYQNYSGGSCILYKLSFQKSQYTFWNYRPLTAVPPARAPNKFQFNFNNNANDTNDSNDDELSFTTSKFAIAMSVAETEAGEEEGLVRVPYSGPSGSTFRDYKY